MRCRRCGIQIPSGTMCEHCYNEVMSNVEADKDNSVVMKITRKFLPRYQFWLNIEWIIFLILACLISIVARNIFAFLGSLLCVILIFAFTLFINKRIAVGTKCVFYETKVVYTFDFMFIHKRKVIKYSDIKDITYNQSSGYKKRLQKKYNLGNIAVIDKKSKILFSGFIINDVQNIEEVFKKLTEKVGNKIF